MYHNRKKENEVIVSLGRSGVVSLRAWTVRLSSEISRWLKRPGRRSAENVLRKPQGIPSIPLVYFYQKQHKSMLLSTKQPSNQATKQPQLNSLNLTRFPGFDGAVLWLGLAISRVGSMPCLLACTVARVATGRYSLRVKHQKRWLKLFRNQTFTGI